ncbi:MAG: protein kinase [Candidatus Sumerlaeota bacterium]|nr:protein kinase [Candidatus Sumerlaeota bacterium]
MATVTWLHLSDFHLCANRTGWDAGRILSSLKSDLLRLQDEHALRPDLLFVTGDLAFGEGPGSQIRDQYSETAALLDGLRSCYSPPIPAEMVFIVPGNHDINRQAVSADQTEWLDRQKDPFCICDMIHDANVQWRRYAERLEEYSTFLSSAGYTHLLQDPSRLLYACTPLVSGIRVGVAGFNSAWSSCRDDEKGKLWLGAKWQAETLMSNLRGCVISVALTHHPIAWLAEQEEQVFSRLIQQNFDFHLHGHEHLNWVQRTGNHVRIAAAACYDRSDRENGYSLARLDIEKDVCDIWLRQYDHLGGGWVPRPISTYAENGVWTIRSLPFLQRIAASLSAKTTHRRSIHTPVLNSIGEDKSGKTGQILPAQFGPLVPIRELGRGSFGVVYLVRHSSAEVLSALKKFAPDRFSHLMRYEAYQRFTRGIRIMRDLAYPGVVQIYNLHDEGMDDCYYTMEYCELGSLRGFSKRALEQQIPFDVIQKVRLIISLCETISYAHSKLVVHRDIKPSNILITREQTTGALYAKLADFDLAFQRGDTGLTQGPIGSFVFLPPEVRNDLVRQEAESLMHYIPSLQSRAESIDSYGVSAILYYLLTGCYPSLNNPKEESEELQRFMLKGEGTRDKALHEALARIVENSLSPLPELRPVSVRDLCSLLQNACSDPVSVFPERRFSSRHRPGQYVSAEAPVKYFSAAKKELLKAVLDNVDVCIIVLQDHAVCYATASLEPLIDKGLVRVRNDQVVSLLIAEKNRDNVPILLSDIEDELLNEKKEEVNRDVKMMIQGKATSTYRIQAKLVPWKGKAIVLLTIRDVTKESLLESQLWQSQKMESLGLLAGGVAHDLNNLFQAILGYTKIQLHKAAKDSDLYADLTQVIRASESAVAVIRQLLLFSRRQTVERRIVDLNHIVKDITKMLRRIIGENISLRFHPESFLNLINVDPGQIEQVLMNLVVNARDAMPNGGQLTIETHNITLGIDYVETQLPVKPGKYVLLEVADTGCGMTKEVLQRIFEPFFTTKEKGVPVKN